MHTIYTPKGVKINYHKVSGSSLPWHWMREYTYLKISKRLYIINDDGSRSYYKI